MESQRGKNLNKLNKNNWPVPRVDTVRCDGCGLCVKVCRNEVLLLEDGVAVVVFPDRCNYSGLCEQVCPKGAIQRMFEIIWSGETSGDETPDVEFDPDEKDP